MKPSDDSNWLETLPNSAEFLTPSGMRCRLSLPEEYDDPKPSDDHVCIEIWACGNSWVTIQELRTWKPYGE